MKAKTTRKALWAKASTWAAKARRMDFTGPLPEGVKSALISQTKSSWSRARGVKIGADTNKLVVYGVDLSMRVYGLSQFIEVAKREAQELLGIFPKPVTPVEMTPAQAQRSGLVYHDANGDARGYCYLCSRAGFKVDRGRELSRHGYQRPGWGYTFGECDGSHRTPEETLAIALDYARAKAAELVKRLATDLIAETTERVENDLKAAEGRHNPSDRFSSGWEVKQYSKQLAAMGENGAEAVKLVADHRNMLEREQTANADWLKMLEAVIPAAAG